MRYFFLSFILTFGLAYAENKKITGLPDQDPITQSLRKRFKQAKKASIKDIINREIICTDYSAIKDQFEREEFTLKFHQDLKLKLTMVTITYPDSNLTRTFPVVAVSHSTYGQSFALVLKVKSAPGGKVSLPVFQSYRLEDPNTILIETFIHMDHKRFVPAPDIAAKAISKFKPDHNLASSYAICDFLP
jgi:hypothetical protein